MSILCKTISRVLLLLGVAGFSLKGAQIDFDRDVRPILSENCFQCHGPDEKARKAKLRLDTKEGALRVSDGSAAVIPGNSTRSELYKRIVATDPDDLMPPPKSNRKLDARQISTLKQWIDSGAPWSEHWSFQPITRPTRPTLKTSSSLVRNEIDSFVLARLEKEGLEPSPEAEPLTLLRRVSLDLTGLPPGPELINAFERDSSAKEYDRMVSRLLNSQSYGERMAWDWLDVARYADSNGYQGDSDRTMWPWRDWVVQAFNRNLPYDRFTVWQIAGDLLPEPTPEQKLATGFCRNHPINGEGGRIPAENRVDYVMDMAETVGTAWLGLTLNCCRCHDHKFDPLTRQDYYSFFAFFNQTPVDGSGGDPQSKPNLEVPNPRQQIAVEKAEAAVKQESAELQDFEKTFLPQHEAEVAKLDEKLRKTLQEAPGRRNKTQLSDLEKQWEKETNYVTRLKATRVAMERRDGARAAIPKVMIMEDLKSPRETFILEKGIYDKPRDKVTANVPVRLHELRAGSPTNRLTLANWLVDSKNPLTARVIVNRFWQQFFGIGLVKTAEDFGAQGEKPLQTELLDWLASEFIASGWDVKHLCRLIVESNTYRQSSKVSPALLERDPDNRLLARGPRFRMPSWMIRDHALSVSGLLNSKVGGAPVKPYQPSGVWEDATFGSRKYQQDHGEALYRRSIYTFWRRIVAPTMFFDVPSRAVCTVKQFRTNIPLHALVTMNDTTYVEAARALGQMALKEGGNTDRDRIEFAFRRTLMRKPAADEAGLLLSSLNRLRGEFAIDVPSAEKLLKVGESARDEKLDLVEHAAFTGVCLALLNLDETVTKE